MLEINFYHLTKTPIEKALPKLLEKVISTNARAIVKSKSEERVEELNKSLWTYTTKFFLPHGSKNDGFAEEQPIYLTNANENPNNATILALTEGVDSEEIEKFQKCLYMFDGGDPEQLKSARNHWKDYNNKGYTTTYWKQNKKGAWEQGGN